jgi:hypothetical protein
VPSTLKREKAVLALLQQPTQEKAAKQAGIGLRTLKRWLTDLTFQEALRKAKSEALADATAKLRLASGQMVQVLVQIAKNRKANTAARVSAARCVLELGLDAHVMEELEARLRVLELQGQSDEKFKIN